MKNPNRFVVTMAAQTLVGIAMKFHFLFSPAKYNHSFLYFIEYFSVKLFLKNETP